MPPFALGEFVEPASLALYASDIERYLFLWNRWEIPWHLPCRQGMSSAGVQEWIIAWFTHAVGTAVGCTLHS